MFKQIFDLDDIYDLLYAINIDSFILSLIGDAFDSHFPDFYAICLVQRRASNTCAWAENWTEIVLEFLKPLTRTGLLNNSFLSGSYFGFESEYKLNLPQSLNFPDFPDRVTLKVHAGKSISISWLSRSHDVRSASYCDAVGNKITCWQRNARLISAPKDKDLDIELDFSRCLLNSCVIDGDALLVGITNGQKELIMYEFLQQTLTSITNQLRLSNPRILHSFDLLKMVN